jgi:ABC-2 type transport system permease protein
MSEISSMIWVESLKAFRSRVPLLTVVGSFIFPLGVAFLIFVSRNPDIAGRLGLIGAKANLTTYAATDWLAYLKALGEIVSGAGLFLAVLVMSWVFGREFVDGTLKDMLPVPVRRSSILFAKFAVVAVWFGVLAFIMYVAGVTAGSLLNLPGASLDLTLQGAIVMAVATCMVTVVASPFALLASIGRGYLLPVGVVIVTVVVANLAVVVGRGEYFPWAVPGLFTQGPGVLGIASYAIVLLTGLLGIFGTYLWWKESDQSR